MQNNTQNNQLIIESKLDRSKELFNCYVLGIQILIPLNVRCNWFMSGPKQKINANGMEHYYDN